MFSPLTQVGKWVFQDPPDLLVLFLSLYAATGRWRFGVSLSCSFLSFSLCCGMVVKVASNKNSRQESTLCCL